MELRLTRDEQALLASLKSHQGFEVMVRMARNEVEKLTNVLLNTDPADREAVLAAHMQAKTAAVLLTMFVNRMNFEIDAYLHTPKKGDKPIDITKGMLDMGSFAEDEPEEII